MKVPLKLTGALVALVSFASCSREPSYLQDQSGSNLSAKTSEENLSRKKQLLLKPQAILTLR
jgi:hypothetical protein